MKGIFTLVMRAEAGRTLLQPGSLTDEGAWRSLVPSLLQAHQLATDLIDYSTSLPLPGGAWVGNVVKALHLSFVVLTRQPASCIHGPLWQVKAAATTIRAVLPTQRADMPEYQVSAILYLPLRSAIPC